MEMYPKINTVGTNVSNLTSAVKNLGIDIEQDKAEIENNAFEVVSSTVLGAIEGAKKAPINPRAKVAGAVIGGAASVIDTLTSDRLEKLKAELPAKMENLKNLKEELRVQRNELKNLEVEKTFAQEQLRQ